MLPATYYISLVRLDADSDKPLYRQLYEHLKEAILQGQLAPSVRLPSSRDLAEMLDISRNTVLNAFDQLAAEGYLVSKRGSGTYVNDDLSLIGSFPLVSPRPESADNSGRSLSALGEAYRAITHNFGAAFRGTVSSHRVFPAGLPAVREFPIQLWSALVARHTRTSPLSSFRKGYGAAGYAPLRAAVAEYLRSARGVRCEAEQVIMVAGSQQAAFLIGQLLLNPGDTIWWENPGYITTLGALRTRDITIVPVPVDAHGVQVETGIALAPDARLVGVTPSHQFPLGYSMSLERRLRLIHWAEEAGAWILEDDYDSPYRYDSAPLPSLQGLDSFQRVIYLGTFSKVMFPALRLGYVVVPPDLVDVFSLGRYLIDLHPPSAIQAALAEFIQEGHFTRHIRRMRQLYQERRDCLLDSLHSHLAGALEIGPSNTGMHLAVRLAPELSEQQILSRSSAYHLSFGGLAIHFLTPDVPYEGLTLGFAAATPEEIQAGVVRLAALIESLEPSS